VALAGHTLGVTAPALALAQESLGLAGARACVCV